MTDRQLLETYAGGHDCQAFGAFVERHEAALLSFATAYLRDAQGAQDVVQETFLRAARYPQRLMQDSHNGSSERNWLLKVARDLSVDCLRSRASERRAVAATPLALLGRGAGGEGPPTPDALAETREEVERMRAAIARLKPRLRELLLLKISAQKSYKEIAAITGLSVTNVGFLLHQAMTKLKEEMKSGGR